VKLRRLRAAGLVALCGWPAAPARAHRLDELLQAALISVRPERVSVNVVLTPGVQVADTLIARIDTNHDGALSAEEVRAYADAVRSELRLSLDGHVLTLRPGKADASSLAELRTGQGVILVVAEATWGAVALGSHELEFENLHAPVGSAYLANALMPASTAVAIDRQERDPRQMRLKITYTLRAETSRKTHGRHFGSLEVVNPFA